MAGKPGRSGRPSIKTIARIAQNQLEASSDEIVAAYIQKGKDGDSAILIDLMNRIAGKVKNTTELQLSGIDFNPSEFYLAYRKGVQQFLDNPKLLEEAKGEVTSPESQENEG